MNGALELLAPAKLNLFLEVLGRRPDGFHELETLLVAIDLADRLSIRTTERPGVHLTLTGPAASAEIPSDGRNLAVRAAAGVLALAAPGAGPAGFALTLEKHVPAGAGLGGASADAAAAALGAARLLGLDPLGAAVLGLVRSLGSDCAFFLEAQGSGLALCHGRGERVTPLALPQTRQGSSPTPFVLVLPALFASTPAVYGALRLAPDHVPRRLANPRLGGPAGLRAQAFNRLEAPALACVDGLREWRALLDAVDPGGFHLSGSGASFFGIPSASETAAGQVREIRVRARDRNLGLRDVLLVHPSGSGITFVRAD